MLLLLISVLATSAQTNSSTTNIIEFCSSRPLGLYCDPSTEFGKIECPSGTLYTCPKAPQEHCQERGILNQFGFKGGVARCVPKLDSQAVQTFCSNKTAAGVYCWGDVEGNVRVQCPTGLVYKCRTNSTTDSAALVCQQTSPTYAVCLEGPITPAGNLTCTNSTRTVISTQTLTSVSVSVDYITVNLTQRVTETLGPKPFTTNSTIVNTYTQVNYTTRVVTVVDTATVTSVNSTVVPVTVTPSVVTVFSSCSGNMTSTVVANVTTSSSSAVLTSSSVSSTIDGGISGAGSPIIITPTSTSAIVSTTPISSSSASPVSSSVDGGISAAGSRELPQPTQVAQCSGTNPTPPITPPPNSPQGLRYGYTPQRMTESQVSASCLSLGGVIADIQDPVEHWSVGLQLCEAVWYRKWEGNGYDEACIALYPGGATAVPRGACQEVLFGLCKFGA